MNKNDELINFPGINYDNNLSNGLMDASRDRLERTVKALVLIDSTYKKENKKLRTSINSLEETMRALDEKNGKLQKAVFILTVVTVFVAIIQVLIAAAQVFLEFAVKTQ